MSNSSAPAPDPGLYERSINHPEREDGEVWIKNIPDDDDNAWCFIGWHTKRKGRVAYSRHGDVLAGMRPVFVQRAELEIAGLNIEKVYEFMRNPKRQLSA